MSITKHQDESPEAPEWLGIVVDQVRELRFGVVQIVVHDGRVAQIERTEKVRLAPTDPTFGSPRKPALNRPDHRRPS